jgi:DNA-binding transcriptional LysR family regulator
VLERALPHVTFHLSFGAGGDLLRRVRDGTLSCAIGSMRIVDPGLFGDPLHEERYVLVGAPKRLARYPLRSEQDLGAQRLIDLDPSQPLTSYLRDAPGGAALTFGEARSMGTIAAVRELVLGGSGIAVLPEYLVADDLKRKRLTRLLPRRALRADWFRLISRTGDERAALFASIATLLRDQPLR